MACIAHADERVDAVAAELAHPTPALVDGAPSAIDRATDLRACDAPTGPLRDPATRAHADALTSRLATLDAALVAGRYAEVRREAEAVATEAARAGLADVEAHGWELAAR